MHTNNHEESSKQITGRAKQKGMHKLIKRGDVCTRNINDALKDTCYNPKRIIRPREWKDLRTPSPERVGTLMDQPLI